MTSRRDFRFLSSEEVDEWVAQFAKPIGLRPESGNWISAREALEILIHDCGLKPREAEQAFCRRVLRWIPAKVETFSRDEEAHEYVDDLHYRSLPIDDLSHFSPKVTGRAWREVIQIFDQLSDSDGDLFSNGIEYARWSTGDFKVTIEKDFSDVTFEIVGLKIDRVAFLESIGMVGGAKPPRPKMSANDLDNWIAACPTDNSKEAWKLLRKEQGEAAPKRDEVFLPAWRKVRGSRGQGRPKKSLS